LGDVLKAFASDLSGALPESSSENVKDTSEKLAKSSEEVGNIGLRPEWTIVDSICSFLFAMLVLMTTKGVIQDIIDVMIEQAPRAAGDDQGCWPQLVGRRSWRIAWLARCRFWVLVIHVLEMRSCFIRTAKFS